MTQNREIPNNVTSLQDTLKDVTLAAEQRLKKQWRALQKRKAAGQPSSTAEQKFLQNLAKAEAELTAKRVMQPAVTYPEALPVSARKDEIAALLQAHQVVVLAGETGSGKTTQLPKICLEIGRGVRGKIGHTQPRRIAATTVANRIAQELKVSDGEAVGFQVRFSDRTSANTYIKVMTDGILLAEIKSDPLLLQYDTIIIDEAHERSLNIDFLLGYLHSLLPKRPDLKLIITSATIDLERFSAHFDNAPIIEVSGRTFPVDIQYRPPENSDDDLNGQIIAALEEITAMPRREHSDILVFLSGEREIREAAQAIRKAAFPQLEVLPLYARLSIAEQTRVFSPHRGRRVVLATNVAETSITVPGIGYVIDPGTARISRYSLRTKVQRLPIEPISQASANQRAGRCGRVADGLCIRLYSEEDFLTRPEFTDAEILRTNLASVVLQMLNLNVGEIHKFPFVDPPDNRLIKDAFKLLEELQAVDAHNRLTVIGRQLTELPLDPRLGRMVVAAAQMGSLREVLIIASALTIQDPRERPAEKQQAADQQHRRFWHEESDFLALVNLWQYAEDQRTKLSQNQWRKQAAAEFINHSRLREWRELHHQVHIAVRKVGLQANREAASYEAVHSALLTGLISNVALKSEENSDFDYYGTRNRKLHIFPGSSQAKKRPKWLVAAQMIETSRVFAHIVARIEPDWVLCAAAHLLKHHYYEPRYSTKTGQVMAYDRITLLGLIVADRQRVNYSLIDPVLAREVFIRQALVEGGYQKARPAPGRFYKLNRDKIAEVEALEAKSRRRDILVSDQVVFDFYNERIPETVVNLANFEHWRKKAEIAQPGLLEIPQDRLMQHAAQDITQAQFPNELTVAGMVLPLTYHFEPGHPDDGVSIGIPIELLQSFPEPRLQWLVPGMLREKCIVMVKSLPKQWRKRFVPVPDFVDRALNGLTPSNAPLTDALSEQLQRIIGQPVPKDIWGELNIDDYYRFNIHVLDDRGKVLARSRNLADLRAQYRQKVQSSIKSAGSDIEREDLDGWTFGDLPKEVLLRRGQVSVKAFPALVATGQNVDLRVLDDPVAAKFASEKGICVLLAKKSQQSVKYLQKSLLKNRDLGLSVVDLGSKSEVIDDIVLASIQRCCLTDGLPANTDEFDAAAAKLGNLVGIANDYEQLLLSLLQDVVQIKKRMKESRHQLQLAFTYRDLQTQLQGLMHKGFLFATPWPWLKQYPRYLKAIQVRLDKAPQQVQKDRLAIATVEALWAAHLTRLETEGPASFHANPDWQQYRWMIEELRVSLFAQALGTVSPVSEKRLNKLWQQSL